MRSCSHTGTATAPKSPKQMVGAWVGSGLLRFQEEQRENRGLLGELKRHIDPASCVFSHPLLHKHTGHKHSGEASASGRNVVGQ